MSDLTRVRCVLAVQNLAASVGWYTGLLGMAVDVTAPGWAFLSRGSFRLMLGECSGTMPAHDTSDHSYFAYVTVEGIDDFYGEVSGKGGVAHAAARRQAVGDARVRRPHPGRPPDHVRPGAADVMKKTVPAASPEAYVRALSGWQRATVTDLRAAVLAGAKLDEVIKWGNLVYLSNGPVAVIRAEGERVLLGFWRGQRLREIESRLKPGGKYEMATLTLREGDSVSAAVVKRLAREAVRLNRALGDPTGI